MQLEGIHHLTAISADAPGNRRFYEGVLGMRLVKKTVNQDDVAPITCSTPTGWLARQRCHLLRLAGGAGAARHAFDRAHRAPVAGEKTLDWWKEHLGEHKVAHAIAERDGRLTLDFEDPEGQR
jgi:glyoxalase family protein